MLFPGIELGILTGLPLFVVMRRRHVHASVHPIYLTSVERAPRVSLLVGTVHRGPDILEEPLSEINGPTLIRGGFGIAGLLPARGFLSVHFLLEMGVQGN